ncbi:hypothetical protein Klosneuvirus_4_131 [Klosneuvirus KNV1]|uniref:Uncharacterized protein n=1 Tax=Klosneuvirus KNV1 TaxID=1977640 RepID=A0A1V0SKT1_9VIRU|nr:hypothetical protein Klosneuvirus_4_131 [Klosneuvirus KNV1]
MVYIYHSTNIDNLINILNDKVLYANKYIEKLHRRLSTTEDLPYIYTSLYVEESLNDNFGIALIFDPNILYNVPFIFNYGWLVHPNDKSIYVYSDDDKDVKNTKINQISDFVKNAKSIMDYEILFIGRIILKEYLIGILCPECDKTTLNKIKSILKKNKLDKVQLYTSTKLPDL